MRNQNLDQGWEFGYGTREGFPGAVSETRLVDLPHDYMIESDVTQEAEGRGAMGFYRSEERRVGKECL